MYTELKNNIDFYLRNKFKISRKNFVEKNPNLVERNKKENLYTFDILSKYLDQTPKDFAKILDIGCKNWFYAKGEYNFFEKFCNKFELHGVELDAYRLYTNFYSRFETAKYYIQDLKNTKYIADNLLNLSEKYDYIIWFLPFVLETPLKYWGLPKKFFCPQKLLLHACNLLKSNGELLIINQGEIEAKEQEKFLKELGINYTYLGEIKSEYFQYQHKRFGFLIKKA